MRLSGYVAFGWGLGGDEAVAVVVYPAAARVEAQADRLAQLMAELTVRGEPLTAGLDIGDVEVDGRVLSVTMGPVDDLENTMLAAEPLLLFSTS